MENNQQNQISSQSKMLWYIIGGVLLLVILSFSGSLLRRNTSEKTLEKAIETQTGGSAKVDIGNTGAATIETNQGTFSTENKLPSNWPSDTPTYPNSKITYSGTVNDPSGKSGISISLTTADSVKNVIDYFLKELKSNNWEITASTNILNGTSVQAKKDTRIFAIIASRIGQQTQITLAVGKL